MVTSSSDQIFGLKDNQTVYKNYINNNISWPKFGLDSYLSVLIQLLYFPRKNTKKISVFAYKIQVVVNLTIVRLDDYNRELLCLAVLPRLFCVCQSEWFPVWCTIMFASGPGSAGMLSYASSSVSAVPGYNALSPEFVYVLDIFLQNPQRNCLCLLLKLPRRKERTFDPDTKKWKISKER